MRDKLNFSSSDFNFLLSSYLGMPSEKTKIIKFKDGSRIRVNRLRAPFTCWGFVRHVLIKHLGVKQSALENINYVKDAWSFLGSFVDRGKEQELDLIFFKRKRYGLFVPGHIGIVTSVKRREYIHAPGRVRSEVVFARYSCEQDGLLGFKRVVAKN